MQDSVRVKRYHQTRRILSVAGFVLDLTVLAALLLTGWTIALRTFAVGKASEPALTILVYLLLFGIVTKAAGLPLDYIRGFWLEHRYGLSNLTFRAWAKDQAKGFLVGAVLAVIALESLYWTMRRWPEHWWVISAAIFVGFFILLANLAPILIYPIFFKFKPLENASLEQKLLELSRRAGRA